MSSILRKLETLRMRKDAAFFCSRALWDEQSGQSVSLATHQREMVDLWQSNKRSVSWCPSEFGKSTLLACWLSWRIGNNPALRVGLLSGTAQQSARLLKLVQICMSRPAYQQAFPGAGVDRVTVDELSVKSRPSTMKDANILAGAFDLSSMLGARFDLAACDDIVGRDHTRTASARDAAFQGFAAVTGSRVGPAGEVHVVGTSEHSDDVPHRLARLPGWTSKRFPALDEKGTPTFPQRWDAARIEARRLELGPVGFQRALMCVPLDEATLVFPSESIERALELGRSGLVTGAGGRCIIAVDPAWTTGPSSDESGIVGISLDDSGLRHLFHVEGLRINVDSLTERVVALALANRATVYVESNGAGGVIASQIGRRVPCKALPTTATAKQARVEALSAELASGRWSFSQPLGTPSSELKKLTNDMLTFSAESHTGDRLSALLIGCEGARAFESRPKARMVFIPVTAR